MPITTNNFPDTKINEIFAKPKKKNMTFIDSLDNNTGFFELDDDVESYVI